MKCQPSPPLYPQWVRGRRRLTFQARRSGYKISVSSKRSLVISIATNTFQNALDLDLSIAVRVQITT